MQTFFVGLSSWIVQDGNYGDFTVGDEAKFALEFYPHSMRPSRRREPECELLTGNRYRIRGEVVYTDRSAYVLDFGILAYRNQAAPKFATKGSWIEAEIYLGIDPFFYFEELHARKGMPALQYRWRIRKIHLETTPWLSSKDEKGRTIMSRAQGERSFIEVDAMDAWNHDDGRPEYVMECEKLS